jgi:hypothetical protein
MKLFRILTFLLINLYSFFTLASIETDSLNIYNDRGLIEKKKIYINDEGLIDEKIFEYQNKNINVLKGLIKNWGGSNFRSFKDVLVNETENQLVIRYISSSMIDNSYIKMIIDLKENKVRIRVYDEGFKSLGLFFGIGFTKNKDICCVNGNGEAKNFHKGYIKDLEKFYLIIKSNSTSINDYIIKNMDSKKNESW